MRKLLLLLVFCLPACSKVTVQQEPFSPLKIQAARPAPPPAPAPDPEPPRVALTASSIKIAEKVQFAYNSDEILAESHSLLDEVAKLLTDNMQVKKVQIEGHTDSTGAAGHNRKLSKRRANSVRKYLIGKGVTAKRLVAKGFGPDKPIADNDTKDGQAANRRVEFNVLEQETKTPAEGEK